MRKCTLCNKKILRGQQMAVFSFPVTATSNKGDYSLIGDFFSKETVAHISCINEFFPTLLRVLRDHKPTFCTIPSIKANNDKNNQTVLTRDIEIYKILREMGENVDQITVRKFLFDNNIRMIDDLADVIKIWFQNRKKMT